jgi:hypothetical protein
MIRHWYRSLLFWLGIPGLLFLVWAWWQSNHLWVDTFLGPGWIWSGQGELLWQDSTLLSSWVVNVPESGFTVLASSEGSSEKFGTLKVDMTAPTRFEIFTGPVDPAERRWFPPPQWQADKAHYDQHFRLFSVPYWLITGAYAAVWLGMVAVWQRRKSRLLKLHAAPLR